MHVLSRRPPPPGRRRAGINERMNDSPGELPPPTLRMVPCLLLLLLLMLLPAVVVVAPLPWSCAVCCGRSASTNNRHDHPLSDHPIDWLPSCLAAGLWTTTTHANGALASHRLANFWLLAGPGPLEAGPLNSRKAAIHNSVKLYPIDRKCSSSKGTLAKRSGSPLAFIFIRGKVATPHGTPCVP